ncbi:hypothetical protein RRG08_067373 [Elysia crispata]|uniref:NAD-dependent epimerase/dehydratase domain-containing protein n=1 Tax=Elysia crispata TaxID=231223 RepID=A0AAE1CV44_9GAST|nr:hypothetical protein RRG08_067373 [Elysia crispata]
MRSKTLAEKAAWDFVKDLPHGKKFSLCTILPVGIFGPPLSDNSSESIDNIVGIFEGKVAMIPKLTINGVDVRDVSEAHVRCLTTPDAAGKRFLLDSGNFYYPDLVKDLSDEFGPQGYKIPVRQMPNPLLKMASCFSEQVKDLRTLGEHPKVMDTDNLRNLLGIDPIPVKKTMLDMSYALIELGKIKKTDKYHGPQNSS